jgi:hypothetical protein
MDFAFPWPFTQGEWLAWTSALITTLLGLVSLVAPRARLRVLRLHDIAGVADAAAEARGQLGGFYIGIGIAAIMFAQPLVYTALGFAWAMAALGRLLSMLADGSRTLVNFAYLVLCIVLAALPLGYAFGFIP